MRVLILGGYGLIGSAITKALLHAGHDTVGLGRSARKGKALIPAADWLEADISTLTQPKDWFPYLVNIDVVVNASGALQNGLANSLTALQRDSIIALIKACEAQEVKRFIQISAPDADMNSPILFYNTKAAADEALKASTLGWTIFRPALVISPHAYGGTSLVRQLAGFPIVQPIMMGNAPVQTVCIDDVSGAVLFALENGMTKIDVDLAEDGAQTLLGLTLAIRKWLGFSVPKAVVKFPNWAGRVAAKFADFAGWFGWRSALRSTALDVLTRGVEADAKAWPALTGTPLKTLPQILDELPSTMQERVFARAMLVFPALLLTLSGFWIVSGLIGFAQTPEAIMVLNNVLPDPYAKAFVLLGSAADVAIGVALLMRPWARRAAWASIMLASSYLVASVILTSHLWADPLGPMVKVFPAIALSLILAALLEER